MLLNVEYLLSLVPVQEEVFGSLSLVDLVQLYRTSFWLGEATLCERRRRLSLCLERLGMGRLDVNRFQALLRSQRALAGGTWLDGHWNVPVYKLVLYVPCGTVEVWKQFLSGATKWFRGVYGPRSSCRSIREWRHREKLDASGVFCVITEARSGSVKDAVRVEALGSEVNPDGRVFATGGEYGMTVV